MIRDEIDYLEREYRDKYRGNPEILKISPENLALLREELDLDEEEDFTYYHGMELVVEETYDQLKIGSYEES